MDVIIVDNFFLFRPRAEAHFGPFIGYKITFFETTKKQNRFQLMVHDIYLYSTSCSVTHVAMTIVFKHKATSIINKIILFKIILITNRL